MGLVKQDRAHLGGIQIHSLTSKRKQMARLARRHATADDPDLARNGLTSNVPVR